MNTCDIKFNYLISVFQILEREEVREWKEKNDSEEGSEISSDMPQLVVQQFSMEALHHTINHRF